MERQKSDDTKKQDVGQIEAVTSQAAPDGGYGWVIVASCFVLTGMIDGTYSALGVLVPLFVDYFSATLAQVTVIGSVMGGTIFMAGPLVGGLINFCGCRLVSMVGGLLITSGILMASFAQSVTMLIVTFGFITGLGLSMICVCSIVILGFYFDRRRAMASGIGQAGAGIGMLLMAPFTAFLIEHFDWRTTLIFVACVTLQTTVAGALLRPLPLTKSARKNSGSVSDLNPKENGCAQHMEHENVKSQKAVLEEGATLSCSVDRAINKIVSSNSYVDGKSKPESKVLLDSATQKPTHKRIRLLSENDKESYLMKRNSRSQHLNRSQNSIARNSPLLRRKDIFYSGSIDTESIQYLASLQSLDNDTKAAAEHSLETPTSNCNSECCVLLKEMFDVRLLKNARFLAVSMSNVFFQMGYMFPVLFITDYGISVGIHPSTAALFVSFYGVATIFGRIFGGIIGNLPFVNPTILGIVSLWLAAGLFFVLPLCRQFIAIAVCIVSIGIMMGPIVPLTTVFLVDAVGLERFTSALGLLSLMKGIANFFGAPMAGALFDATGSYIWPFGLAGVLFFCAGASLCPLYVIEKRETSRGTVAYAIRDVTN